MADTNLVRGKDYIKIEDGRTSYYYQMEHITLHLWYPLLGDRAFLLYNALCSLATGANGSRSDVGKVTVEQLAQMTGTNKDGIKNARNRLRDLGFIQVYIPSKTQQSKGNRTTYRVLNAPRELTLAHIAYGRKHDILDASIVTFDDYYEKKVVAKWLVRDDESLLGELDWEKPEIDLVPTRTGVGSDGNQGWFATEPANPDFSTSNRDRDRDNKIPAQNPLDSDAGTVADAQSEAAASLEVSPQPNSDTGYGQKHMTVDEYRERLKQHTHRVTRNSKATGDVVARGSSGKIYATDLKPDDVARVALAAVNKLANKERKYLTENQYAQLCHERMTLKDGRTMHPPAWYMERYPDRYRTYIETVAIRSLEKLDQLKVGLSGMIKILLHPDWYNGWLSYMHSHGLSDGLPETTTERIDADANAGQPAGYGYTDSIVPDWVTNGNVEDTE